MKAFILCGGQGTRLDYESYNIPKAMVTIGKIPILLHLVNLLCKNGITEFVLCLGYKKKLIKNFLYKRFKDSIFLEKKKNINIIRVKYNKIEIKFYLIDTGKKSGTGGRIKIANHYLNNSDPFLMTYCDGLANIKISELFKKHKKENKLVTVTAVNPQHRYGILKIKKNLVIGFNNENPKQNIFINGGFFIINPKALKYIKSNYSFWEKEPMETFIKNKQLSCYVHKGFWASLDTQKDKIQLNKLWKSGKAQWI